MTKLLRLGTRKDVYSAVAQIFLTNPTQLWWWDEKVIGDAKISIVPHHTRITHLRHTNTVKLGEILILEGTGKLNHTIPTEVEAQHRISVLNRTDGLVLVIDDHKGRVVLIGYFAILRTKRGNRLLGAVEVPGITKHVGVSASLDDMPIGLIPVHRHDHSTTTTGNPGITPGRPNLLQYLLELLGKPKRGPIWHITAIVEHV